MTVENISWSISIKKNVATWMGSNLQPPDHQLDTDTTEPQLNKTELTKEKHLWSDHTS